MKMAGKKLLGSIFDELKSNPPKILVQAKAKECAAQSDKQRIAIAFSKAGLGKKK